MASPNNKMEQPSKRSAAKKMFDKAVGNPENQPESVHTIDYIRGTSGDLRQGVIDYVSSLFPFLQWAPRYNLTWLLGDLIA
jgi:sodium-independent sulfate anion transporter 11